MLDQMIEGASASGVDEIYLGMAHRGRLNVLSNIVGDPETGDMAERIFGAEAQGGHDEACTFMSSEVSREKPVKYAQIIDKFLENRGPKGRILWVIGPALVHARGREAMEWLIHHGFCHVLFGGNAVGVHDIEAALYGSTLGMKADGSGAAGGHAFHMRAINEVKKAGGIARLVESGKLRSGIMHACTVTKTPYVLAGSIRDDGPLPDLITDALLAQQEMRSRIRDVTFCLMIATTLHSVAVGNLLPAWVKVVCVDINPSTVIKLNDRGSIQTVGLVTDVEPVLRALVQDVEELAEERRGT